ncbi:hypothetical protein C8J56DRAFT_793202 [Mycena floridula]|nr:hypothetical protein C8J56DRAFT_793202 [Mycena floridula]
MRAFTFIFAAVLVALKVNGDLVAFSGDSCDGNEGNDAPCDGSCISFSGRHSFEVTASSNRCVTLFQNGGCTGESFNFGSEAPGECINVNTGTDIESFSCVPC